MIYLKLQNLGIIGNLRGWLTTFLKIEFSTMAVNGATSKETQMGSGTLQDTALGLLLFKVTLSDMPSAAQIATLDSYAENKTFLAKLISGNNAHLQLY